MADKGSGTCAVVLAAGLSSRMGETGFKPLLQLQGQTVLCRVLSSLAAAGVTERIVVTGHNAADVAAVAGQAGASSVHNPDYAQGMFGSVQTGVAALPEGCRRFFLWPVDIPLVRPATLRSLLRRHDEGLDALYPLFSGERGHPPLLSARLRPEVLRWHGEAGLRGLLESLEAREPQRFAGLSCPDRGVLLDADTPEDFAALQRLRPDLPSERECEALLFLAGTPQRAVEHGQAVARVALAFGRALQRQGQALDMELVQTAAWLHDVAKGRPRHEEEGGRILDEVGFTALAAVVAAHRDIPCSPEAECTERELVFLADKYAAGERFVPIRQRYGAVLERHGHEPEARAAIEGRQRRALDWEARLQTLIGQSPEALARQAIEEV